MILNSLPLYLSFLNHYRMTKPAVNYHNLLRLLQTYEKDNQLQKSLMNLVKGSSFRLFKKEKKKKKNKNKKEKLVPHAPS